MDVNEVHMIYDIKAWLIPHIDTPHGHTNGLCTVGPSLICTCTPHKESHTQAIHQVLCCQNGKQIQKHADLFDMHSSNSDI